MSTFRNYYLGLKPEQRERFARRAGRSSKYLLLVAYGHKRVSPETALAIEAASRGEIKAESLCQSFCQLLKAAGYQKEPNQCPLPDQPTPGQATPRQEEPPSSPAASEAES